MRKNKMPDDDVKIIVECSDWQCKYNINGNQCACEKLKLGRSMLNSVFPLGNDLLKCLSREQR